MNRGIIEWAVEDRDCSAALESLKRARKKAGITAADIKPATRKSSKDPKPATNGSTAKKSKPPKAKDLTSSIKVTLTRTEADIKEHTERKEKLEAELNKIIRTIGCSSMTATMKRQQIREEEQKIKTLEGIRDRCRKQLCGDR